MPRFFVDYILIIISGPHYWGMINPTWVLCSKGKNQSPINIEPKDLLFDPGLKHIKLTGKQVNIKRKREEKTCKDFWIKRE